MQSFYDLMRYAKTGLAPPRMSEYDKLKALAMLGTQSGNIQTLTGQPPLSFRSDGSPLISWSMKGNGSQSATPTPDNPIMPDFCGVRTANLAPPLTEWVDGYINAGDGLIHIPTNAIEKTSGFLEIPDNAANVTMSGEDGVFEVGTSGAWRVIGFYDSDMRFISRVGGTGANYISASVPENAKFMRISCRTYESDKEYMLNSGSSPLPYEPYGYKIPITCAGQTVPVYLGQTQTVRRIKKLVLTWEEMWSKSTSGGINIFVYSAPTIPNCIDQKSAVSTHYIAKVENRDGVFYFLRNNLGKFTIYADAYSTADEFKSYLASQYAAGTPVTVWYVLAEPETGIVNEPLAKIGDYADEVNSASAGIMIPTVNGQNTLTVDTDLQPSEMTIMYRAKEE